MRQSLILTCIMFTCSCLSTTRQDSQQTISPKQKNVLEAVKRHFDFIDSDSIRKTYPELIDSENVKLQQTIRRYQAELFNLEDTLNFDLLYVVKSADKRLCLVSWDTRLGGTLIDFATMAIFKTSGGQLVSQMLVDSSSDYTENTLMHYNRLYTLNTANGAVYVAHGFGQGSSALPWQELRAFKIESDQLLNAPLFPGSKPNLFVEFDTHHLDQEIPMIEVTDSGKTISYPIADDRLGFTGKYQKLIFRDTVYRKTGN